MKPVFAFFAAALLFLILTVIPALTGAEMAKTGDRPVRRLAIPDSQIYTGAYIDFGEREDNVTPESIVNFEKLVGRPQAIIGFSSDWGMLSFPKQQLQVIRDAGAVPLIYWSPFDRPLGAPRAQNRFQLKKILDGEWDAYIDSWSRQAADAKMPLLVAWGLEMNGQWFPWSGSFYGAGFEIPGTNPPQYLGPETFKKVYRYVVDRAKRQGAYNIEWVFHANNTSDPAEPWNAMKNYYPGDDYVDWLGMSAYGQQYPDQKWPAFDLVITKPYAELAAIHPAKPIILAEWGIGEFPDSGDKAAWLEEAFRRIPAEFPRIKAAVYWHEQWKNGDGKMSNLKADSSPRSLEVFRRAMTDARWADKPVFAR